MVVYKKGHKNSKGEAAPWTIVSHETGKILSSHPSKTAAEEHLKQMEYYKHAKPKTEGVKDLALAGALAVSPMASVDAGAATHKPVETIPVTNDYSKVQFNKNVQYKLTPEQYKKLAACHNLPANYVVPKSGSAHVKPATKTVLASKDTVSQATPQTTQATQQQEPEQCGTMCTVGRTIGSGAKSAWNGIKSLGQGIYDGWNGKNESVEDFGKWLDEQTPSPITEAVKQMYNTLFESSEQ